MREKIKGSSLGEKVEKEAEEFSESLSERQRELHLSYWQVESQEWSAEVDEAFLNGFKIGAKLMKEMLEE